MPQPDVDQFGPSTFTGKGVEAFQALTIASALDFYKTTGMKVNSAYTPKNMMTAASKLTGKTFKARDYSAASAALRTHAEGLRK